MILKQRVENYLYSEPRARERRVRAKAVWNILEKVHGRVDITKERFVDTFFTEIQSINRLILKVQQERPELRGKDYDQKDEYEQKAQIDLGYETGFYNDTSKKTRDRI